MHPVAVGLCFGGIFGYVSVFVLGFVFVTFLENVEFDLQIAVITFWASRVLGVS